VAVKASLVGAFALAGANVGADVAGFGTCCDVAAAPALGVGAGVTTAVRTAFTGVGSTVTATVRGRGVVPTGAAVQ
jgi:hypothetical protein